MDFKIYVLWFTCFQRNFGVVKRCHLNILSSGVWLYAKIIQFTELQIQKSHKPPKTKQIKQFFCLSNKTKQKIGNFNANFPLIQNLINHANQNHLGHPVKLNGVFQQLRKYFRKKLFFFHLILLCVQNKNRKIRKWVDFFDSKYLMVGICGFVMDISIWHTLVDGNSLKNLFNWKEKLSTPHDSY